MNTIENVLKLEHFLEDEVILKLKSEASKHKKQSNISFTIKNITNETLEILTVQNITSSGIYASEATLVKRTENLFRKIVPGVKLLVSAQTYLPSATNLVTASWIDKKMHERGIKIKRIAFDTGLDRESISDWVTGKRSMNQLVKAMFYFYLMNNNSRPFS